MIKNKDIFLKEIVRLPELINNTIAFVFASNPNIDITSREKFFDNVISYYKRFKDNKPEITITPTIIDNDSIEKWKKRDLRIKSVRLKSVRGIPDSDIPFGIDFVDKEGNPQSMIILGSNAVGKSSIFDAIEYCYCKEVGEAKLRSYKLGAEGSVNYLSFLQHYDNAIKNILINIETESHSLNFNDNNIPEVVRDIINPNTHFISDYDIYSKGQLDFESNSPKVIQTSGSLHNTIAQSLGLEDYLQFEKNLRTFVLYKRQTESRNISSLQKSNDNQNSLIKNNETAINDRKIKLGNLIQEQNNYPQDDKLTALLAILNQIAISDVAYSYNSNEILTASNKFTIAYEEFISQGLQKSNYNEVQFLNLGLDLLKEHDNCPFCNSSTLSKLEIEESVKRRITKVLEFNKSLQKLNKEFEILLNILGYFKTSINSLRISITKEIAFIKDKVEFNSLLILENKFIQSFSEIFGRDFFIEVSGLDDNPNYLKDKYHYLYQLVIKNKEFINIDTIRFNEYVVEFIQSRLGIIRTIESNIRNQFQPISANEQIIFFKKEISDLENQIKEAKNNIERDKKKINEIIDTQNLFNNIKSDTESYLKVLHIEINKLVNKVFDPIEEVVHEVLQYYFDIDDRDLEIIIEKMPDEIDLETGEILSEIITARIISKSGKFSPQPVTKVLNTFHYRLFCTMVSISIAIASRINTEINLPLILDDIFYASDFENRTTIENFLKKIFAIFEKFTKDIPLQLIMFTHDQMIFECVISAMSDFDHFKIAFAKLFPSTEADDAGNYKNLIYTFPNYYPQSILKTLSL